MRKYIRVYINVSQSVIAISQVTSSRCPTAGPRLNEKSIGLGFEFEKWPGAEFLPVLCFSMPILIPLTAPYSLIALA
jgi:hypothetical protein